MLRKDLTTRCLLPCIALFIFPSANAQELPGKKLNLKDAVLYAIERSPILDSAKRMVSIRSLELENAEASFWPSLDLSATHGVQRSDPSLKDSPWVSGVALGLSETLYDNGVSLIQDDIATKKLEESRLLFEQERDQLVRDVAVAHNRLSLLVALQVLQKSRVALLRKQHAVMDASYRQGLKTKRDYLRLKTEVQRAEMDLAAGDNNIQKAVTLLEKLLGVPAEQTGTLAFTQEKEPKIDPKAIPTAPPSLKDHYTTKLAKLAGDEASLTLDLARRQYGPEFTATSGVFYDNPDYFDRGKNFSDNDSVTGNILLAVKVNLWDKGSRRRSLAIAEEQRHVTENVGKDYVLTTRAAIQDLMLDMDRARSDLGLAKELVALEEENFKAMETEYRNGKAQYLDLVTALDDLSTARLKYFTAAFELQQHLYVYRYHQGGLYEAILAL